MYDKNRCKTSQLLSLVEVMVWMCWSYPKFTLTIFCGIKSLSEMKPLVNSSRLSKRLYYSAEVSMTGRWCGHFTSFYMFSNTWYKTYKKGGNTWTEIFLSSAEIFVHKMCVFHPIWFNIWCSYSLRFQYIAYLLTCLR